jgi:AraC-like DNA-binding protein
MGITIERSDSQFGRYTSAAWADPSDPFLPATRIWYFEGTLAHAVERHYPNGLGGIIVQLETPHAPADARGGERFPPVCANGLATKPFGVVAPAGGCRVIGIELDPATLHAALSAPLAELSDVTIDLHAIVGAAAAELGERCAAAHDPAAILRETRDWLQARVARGLTPDTGAGYALRRLQETRGAVSIAALERETGVSGPRLARRFATAFGTTPKRFARILRFRTALEIIRHEQRIDLAAAASAAGYYDQAHMYADFAEFCDRTPAAFARALHYPNTLSIAEDDGASDFSKTA